MGSIVPGVRTIYQATANVAFARAVLAAAGLHAALLTVVLLAVGSHRLPDVLEPSALALVFAPVERSQDRPLKMPRVEPALAPTPLEASPAEAPPAASATLPVPTERAGLLPETTIPAPLPEPPPVPAVAQPIQSQPRVSSPPRVGPPRSSARARSPQPAAAAVPMVPPASTPVAPRAVVAGGQGSQSVPAAVPISDGWRNALLGWLQAHKTYPATARMAGAEGRVLVRFTVRSDGRVLDVVLAQSSGFRSLDDAAVTLLQGARLPAFSIGMAQEEINMTVPLNFRLN